MQKILTVCIAAVTCSIAQLTLAQDDYQLGPDSSLPSTIIDSNMGPVGITISTAAPSCLTRYDGYGATPTRIE
jgi:hypothetical protein